MGGREGREGSVSVRYASGDCSRATGKVHEVGREGKQVLVQNADCAIAIALKNFTGYCRAGLQKGKKLEKKTGGGGEKSGRGQAQEKRGFRGAKAAAAGAGEAWKATTRS